MGRIGWFVVSSLWGVVVFAVVFWAMFPSNAVANRVTYEVERATQGKTLVSLTGVSPWWVGLSANNVVFSSVNDPNDADELPEPMFAADGVAVRVQFFSMLRNAPRWFYALELGDGIIEGSVRTNVGLSEVKAIESTGDDVPLDELLGLMGASSSSFAMYTTGGIDLDVDLKSGRGLAKTDGDLSISGENLVIDALTVETMGWVDEPMNALVDEIDLRVQLTEGAGTITRGVLSSSLIDIEVEGDIVLGDTFDRSRVELELTLRLKDWSGTPLENFRSVVDGYLSSSRWQDGSNHYTANTTLGRLSVSAFRPKTERVSSRPSPSTSRPSLPRPSLPLPGTIGERAPPERNVDAIEARRPARPDMEDDLDEEPPFDDEFDDELSDDEEPLDDEEFIEEGDEGDY